MPAPTSNQFLPELTSARATARVSVQTQTSSPILGSKQDQRQQQQLKAYSTAPSDLPPIKLVPNSALVHQRASAASAGDHLAAASVNAGASLPLMIGNRSKCVVNLVGEQAPKAPAPYSQPLHNHTAMLPAGTQQQSVVPQNSAARAEQRRQNMAHVSVVRPVVNVNQQQQQQPINFEPFGQAPMAAATLGQAAGVKSASSLIDDWMLFDQSIQSARARDSSSLLDELILSSKLNAPLGFAGNEHQHGAVAAQWAHMRGAMMATAAAATTTQAAAAPTAAQDFMRSEQELRQQVLMLRREEHELNRSVMRQHQFVLAKIEERKRHLQIIQSVWAQRDFKHAIEKMVDIYHQGLIFTNHDQPPASSNNRTNKASGDPSRQSCRLRSLNTSLVVDVISVIILRPKLWTLEICQLLLPIINGDLLTQARREHEYYVEIGLKALKLILAHFSAVLKSTFDSLKEPNKLVGVDLSREDRVNKCLACYKLLLEAQATMAPGANCKQASVNENSINKLAALRHELQTMFGALRSSIALDVDQLAQRFRGER